MKKLNKTLSIILSVIMILSLIPLTASAVEYSGTCGENLTWQFDDATGVLTISGTGDMKNYDCIINYPEWYKQRDNIEYVCIEEGVTSIGRNAFRYCSDLKHIEIPDSVTKIGSDAFYKCTELKKITLGTGLVGLATNSLPPNTSIFYNGTLEEWYKFEKNNQSANQYSFSAAGYGIHCSDGDIYPKGVYNDNITWEFNDITGTLSFYGTGDMVSYEDGSDALDARYQQFSNRIKKVVLSEGITSIGDYEFYGFPSYLDFVIPSSVTSISSLAFLDLGLTFAAVIYYGGTIAQWKEIESTFDYHYENNFIVHCIDGDIPIKGTCGENLVWQLDITTGVLTISGSGEMDNYVDNDYQAHAYAPWVPVYKVIKSIIIEEGVETVGNNAFIWNAPKAVTIPESVKTIGKKAFAGASFENVYYMGSETQWNAIEKIFNNIYEYCFYENAKIHYNSEITEYAVTCTSDGYVQYTCSCCEEGRTEVLKEAPGHKYNVSSIEANCAGHGCTKYICESCGFVSTDYTSNPTGHTFNEEGLCEACGEKEVTNTSSTANSQMLSLESILAMIMNLLSKILGLFSVA